MESALAEPVERFIEDLSPVLERIAGEVKMVKGHPAAGDVALEAYNVAAAFIDVDGLHTDEELWAFIATFGPRFETTLRSATPAHVRTARLLVGKKRWLERHSLLYEVLLGDDRRHGTSHSWHYYERTLAIAHAVCSLDAHPARTELEAVDRFRSLLLAGMDASGLARPGRRREAVGVEGAGPGPPEEEARPLEELLEELDALVGLEPVKAEVRLVTNLLRVQRLRRQRGLPVVEASRHLVFTGNPGTGKTTVARLLAQIYRTLELVEKGHLVETDRSQLVAGYVGQTAIQVRKVVEEATGGVLLVDEAYALARGDERDFGQEAIDTLVKLMEDLRDEVVVIAAGYPEEMADFIGSNPGLRSRFPKTIFFPDYSDDELVAIFESMATRSGYRCTPGASRRAEEWFQAQPRDKGFGNARLARNLFEAAMARQASRLVDQKDPTDEDLMRLTAADVGGPDAR